MYQQTENLPERKVGLVLGCSKFARGGQLNQYFINRIKAAHELYSLGKVQFLLVSGDNAQKSYNEPSVMKRDLMAGVLAKSIVITQDFAPRLGGSSKRGVRTR